MKRNEELSSKLQNTEHQFKTVNKLSIGFHNNQVSGLLGPNGAGKSTTLKMIIQDIENTSGNIYIKGDNINNIKVKKKLGWCPQTNPLLDLLTGREHLILFSKLRKIPYYLINDHVNTIITTLSFEKYADKLSYTYSGGNKRKLSLGISLVGSPKVLLLDEPSTGLDPISRYFMWQIINKLKNKCIILTSHLMEECEALCQNIAIIKKGHLQCIGSVSHLKMKFSPGYSIQLHISNNNIDKRIIYKFMINTFNNCQLYNIYDELIDSHSQDQIDQYLSINNELYMNFLIPSNIKLSIIFNQIETNKEKYNIIEYSVSQATLEDVYLTVT